jgi:hypothetical protein
MSKQCKSGEKFEGGGEAKGERGPTDRDTDCMTCDSWPEPMTETFAFWEDRCHGAAAGSSCEGYQCRIKDKGKESVCIRTGHIHKNRGEYYSSFR